MRFRPIQRLFDELRWPIDRQVSIYPLKSSLVPINRPRSNGRLGWSGRETTNRNLVAGAHDSRHFVAPREHGLHRNISSHIDAKRLQIQRPSVDTLLYNVLDRSLMKGDVHQSPSGVRHALLSTVHIMQIWFAITGQFKSQSFNLLRQAPSQFTTPGRM